MTGERITEGLARQAERTPDKPALLADGRQWTYGELEQAVACWATGLARRGLTPGARVAIALVDPAAFLVAFCGTVRAGMVACPLDTALTADELRTLLPAVRADMHVLAIGRPGLPQGEQVVAGPLACARLLALGRPPGAPPRVPGGYPFYIGYTSGSTGRPKGVVRSHLAWLNTFARTAAALPLDGGDVMLVPGPLHFSAALFATLYMLEVGGTVVVPSSFHPGRVLALAQRSGATAAFMVPARHEALLRYQDQRGQRGLRALPGLRLRLLLSAGAKLAPAAREGLERLIPGVQVYEYYGSSEFGYGTLLRPDAPPDVRGAADCLGRPFPGVQLGICDAEGNPLPAGEVGTICARSDMLPLGYDGPAGLLPLPGPPGWVTAGDLGWLDERGYVYLAGRQADLIMSGGIGVFAGEVEAVLRRCPGVDAAAVVGVPDPVRGEVVGAVVVPAAGALLSERAVLRFAGQHLAPYKRPRRLRILAELPLLSAGKVWRQRVQALLGDVKHETC